MCGIAGTFCYGGQKRVDQDALLRVRDRMTSRGPDAAGLWISPDQSVGLAHRRLSIIDLSEGGAQPMVSADGRLRIVFNGEIYNYPALRERLSADGVVFRSHSDTEVLLHLYARKGAAMLEDLRGMYAFFLWDAERRGVLLGRDPFGIKPLYYSNDGGTLRAASQVKALLAESDARPSPDPAGHAGFFLWGHVPEPYTLYKGIRMLEPGATLWVDQDGKQTHRHVVDLRKSIAAFEQSNDQPAAASLLDELRDTLVDSVQHHLLADVPVGVFLSAGLDSSVLASTATSILGENTLRTVTLGFDQFKDTPRDETVLARSTADHFKSNHQTVWVDGAGFHNELPRLMYAMDQPSLDGVNTYFISKVTREAGLKVALSGLGGDEVFGGYPSFRRIPQLTRRAALLGQKPSTAGRLLRRITSPWIGRITSPKYAGLLEYGGSFGGAYLLVRGLFMPWELDAHMDPDMARAGLEALQLCGALEETTSGITSPRLRVSALEMSWYMRNQLLRDSDWAGMAHSIEIRVPLVDMELLRRLGPRLASAQPPTKRDMALAAPIALPESVLNRPKTGFDVPVRAWAMQGTEYEGRGLRGWAKLVYRESVKAV